MADAQWYIIHTITNYEDKVKDNLEQTIKNRGLEDVIQEVAIPMQDVVEIKNGVRKATQKKMFSTYVLVKMVMNEDTWYIVRNLRGVTGFLSLDGKPTPLSEEEVARMGIGNTDIKLDFGVGDSVLVVSGVWEGTVGTIKAINESKQTLTLSVDMFGRETPVELEFGSIRRM
ncbi:MAG: transcription termination/antitermination factor NusG [Lachnospiraceae bacterium]|nr:transcription termination/antitermination factor NusG [Candidatus Minthocola equi]